MAELALLMGNIAHESGAFVYTEEIKCAGNTGPTGECPYSPYHGRGYIQLSWDYNYREAANFLNNPSILSNPTIVMNDPTVNWQTVQWYWVSRVQPRFQKSGVTMGASVRAINGGLECDSGPINGQRVTFIQCFQRQFGVNVEGNSGCPGAATEDFSTEFADPLETDLTGDEKPIPTTFVVALLVLGTLTVVLGLAVVVILVMLKRKTGMEERA